MSTNPDIRQHVSRLVLDRIAPDATVSTPTDLKTIMDSVNFNVKPPLEMRETATPDLTLNVGNIELQDPHVGVRKTIPPISGLLPTFASGTVTFPASSGGSTTNSTSGADITITITTANFLKVGIYILPNGDFFLLSGTEGASVAAATAPPTASGTFPIGFVVLENDGGTIQNIENADIYQYVGGGGGSGDTGYAKIFLSM